MEESLYHGGARFRTQRCRLSGAALEVDAFYGFERIRYAADETEATARAFAFDEGSAAANTTFEVVADGSGNDRSVGIVVGHNFPLPP